MYDMRYVYVYVQLVTTVSREGVEDTAGLPCVVVG